VPLVAVMPVLAAVHEQRFQEKVLCTPPLRLLTNEPSSPPIEISLLIHH
jgi:hypothetical protein